MSSKEWEICRLGELAEKITKGTTPTTIGHPFVERGINFIKAESILIDGNIDSEKFVFIDSETHSKLKRSQIEEGDLLFSMAGMVLGKTAVVRKEFLPANINQALAVIRLKKNLVTPQYVAYFMRQKSFFNYVNQSTGQSAQPNINLEEIGNLEITLPDRPTQTRIAAILSALDDKIELNRKTNSTLEAIAQAIFKKWFVDFRFPGATGEMQDSELGPIPKGWRVGKLGEFGKIICGKTPSKTKPHFFGGHIPFVKIPDMHNSVFITNTVDTLTDEGAISQINKFLPPYSVVVSCIATVGLTALTSQQCQTNQQINAIVPNNLYTSWYLYFVAKNLGNILKDLGSGGSATLNVNTTSFSNIACIIPSVEILRMFSGVVRPLFDKILQTELVSSTLVNIRDNLLPKLVSGEIEV